jgi:Flp pilus assembly CpaF family ATPase
MERLELIEVKFVTGLIGMIKMSDTKITLKKKLHNKLKKIVQVKRMRKMRRRKKHVQSSNFWK